MLMPTLWKCGAGGKVTINDSDTRYDNAPNINPITIITKRLSAGSPLVPSQNLDGIRTIQEPMTVVNSIQAHCSGLGTASSKLLSTTITTVIATATTELKSKEPNSSATRSRGVPSTKVGTAFL